METYEDIIEKSFDSVVSNLGYKIVNRLVSDTLCYVKAYNPNGHLLYIVNDSNLNFNRDNSLLMRPSKEVFLPFSLKNGSMKIMSNACYGLLFESTSKNGGANITIMKLGPDFKPVEENYSIYDGESKDVSSVMNYPIISVSDLIEDPKTILLSTEKNISNFRNSYLIDIQLSELERMIDSIGLMGEKMIEFNAIREEKTEKLNELILKLNRWNSNFQRSDIWRDEENRQHNIVYKNLCYRNESATNLLRIIGKVLEVEKQIEEIGKNLDEAINHMKRSFKDLDQDLIH